MIGDTAFEVALAWMVIETTGSVGALAGILLAHTVPRGALLLLGGAYVDRFSPRLVMGICHVVRAALMAALAVLTFIDRAELWHLYGVAFVMGTSAAFFTPASESVLPAIVPEEQLDRGNALQGLAEQISYIVGPVLGGLLTAADGSWLVFALNALTFAVAAVTVRWAPRAPSDQPSPRVREVIRDIGEGLRHARRTREVRLVLLVISAATLSYSGLFAVGLPILARSMSESAMALALMVSGWGVGQFIGALCAVVTGLPRRWGLLIIVMTVAEGAVFIALGFMPSAWAAALILCLLGIGVSYSSDVALPTFIQTTTPAHLLGRISAVMQVPRVVLEPLSIALLGATLHYSLQWGFALCAVPVLLVGLVLALDPSARRLSATKDRAVQAS
ncbi:MFS transporter [Luteipulveratus mongoliensis]|nr:MFS transporter [Luteipulveratus mongoliensis]